MTGPRIETRTDRLLIIAALDAEADRLDRLAGGRAHAGEWWADHRKVWRTEARRLRFLAEQEGRVIR